MRHTRLPTALLLTLLILLQVTAARSADEDEPVRKAFIALQTALKGQDAEQVWKRLDADSRKAAERAAKAVQAVYSKANADDRAKLEKALGLEGDELARLSGTGYLKSRGFRARYEELSQSKIEKIVVEGDKAIIHYIEPDNDKEKLRMLRQGGEWKATLMMPSVPKL